MGAWTKLSIAVEGPLLCIAHWPLFYSGRVTFINVESLHVCNPLLAVHWWFITEHNTDLTWNKLLVGKLLMKAEKEACLGALKGASAESVQQLHHSLHWCSLLSHRHPCCPGRPTALLLAGKLKNKWWGSIILSKEREGKMGGGSYNQF